MEPFLHGSGRLDRLGQMIDFWIIWHLKIDDVWTSEEHNRDIAESTSNFCGDGS